MPIVNGKRFAYTKKGIAKAKKALAKNDPILSKAKKPIKSYNIGKSANPFVNSSQLTGKNIGTPLLGKNSVQRRRKNQSPSKRLKGILSGLKKTYDQANDSVLRGYSRLSPKTQQNLYRLRRTLSRWHGIN